MGIDGCDAVIGVYGEGESVEHICVFDEDIWRVVGCSEADIFIVLDFKIGDVDGVSGFVLMCHQDDDFTGFLLEVSFDVFFHFLSFKIVHGILFFLDLYLFLIPANIQKIVEE